ncbi:hypothetical protein JZ751_027137 [Albula glossodonta]|uniref:Uncharacterized protein n=1 Tax=Albula glossodonta TaxID=121402 RepID=A0A8T2NGK6_9TELE|nr:hypothetical protein JZ751_027137 [Albula glossodonta]
MKQLVARGFKTRKKTLKTYLAKAKGIVTERLSFWIQCGVATLVEKAPGETLGLKSGQTNSKILDHVLMTLLPNTPQEVPFWRLVHKLKF